MEGFYIAVLVIAVVILMLILTTLGVAMRKGNADVAWPPGDAAKCPIGWEAGTTPTQCRIPDASLISGEIYSTYSNATPPVPLELGYNENTGTDPNDWTGSVGNADYATSKFTVTVTDDIQARAFTANRPIQIGTAAGKIGVVDPVVTSRAKYTYTTAPTLTASNLYKVYTTYVDAVKGVNSVGTGTATTTGTGGTATNVLTFATKPTVALSNSIFAVSSDNSSITSADDIKSVSGTYTTESKTVSFTTAGSPMTTSGAIKFKKAYFDFNDATYTRCGKKVFAKKYNLTWDGVSEYNKC